MDCKRAAAVGACLLVMACFVAPAWSQSSSGWYLGAAAGKTDRRQACGRVATNVQCDAHDIGGRVFAGYQISHYLAVEAAYSDMGEASVTSPTAGSTISTAGWEAVGILMLPVFDRTAFLFKAGVYRARSDLHGSAPIPGFANATEAYDTNSDATYGLGVIYGLVPNVALRLDWQKYRAVGGPKTFDSDIEAWWLGGSYRF